jgi:hypothetical protein
VVEVEEGSDQFIIFFCFFVNCVRIFYVGFSSLGDLCGFVWVFWFLG